MKLLITLGYQAFVIEQQPELLLMALSNMKAVKTEGYGDKRVFSFAPDAKIETEWIDDSKLPGAENSDRLQALVDTLRVKDDEKNKLWLEAHTAKQTVAKYETLYGKLEAK